MQPNATRRFSSILQEPSMELVPSIFIAATLLTTLVFAFDFLPSK